MNYELYKLTVTDGITGETHTEYEYGSNKMDAVNSYLEKNKFLYVVIEKAFPATKAELMDAAVSRYVKEVCGSF